MQAALDSAGKVDFWMLTDEEFDKARFARRVPIDYEGFSVQISRPEDTILAKLKWAEECGGSEKQMLDARRVYEIQFEALDQAYLDTWAGRIGVTDLLQQTRHAANVS